MMKLVSNHCLEEGKISDNKTLISKRKDFAFQVVYFTICGRWLTFSGFLHFFLFFLAKTLDKRFLLVVKYDIRNGLRCIQMFLLSFLLFQKRAKYMRGTLIEQRVTLFLIGQRNQKNKQKILPFGGYGFAGAPILLGGKK